MLKHEDNSEMPTQPSPQVTVSEARVTPEELTKALAAIEARRQAEASRLAGTIPLGQAVSELHLDSSTDEIWTEVQAQRAKSAEAKAASVQQEKLPPAQQAGPQTVTASQNKARHGWMAMFAPILIGWVLLQPGVIPHFWNHSTHISAPVLRPLAQIPEGVEVYADDSAVAQVSEGKPLTQITISENASGNRWTLVKMGGHVYLRGFIDQAENFLQLQGKPLSVYNDDNSGELEGEKTSKITVRVDRTPLQKSSGDDSFSGITISNFQPDPQTTLGDWR